MYEGAPNYPAEDRWWEIVERYGVTIFYTAPTAIRACMKWGVEHPEKHDLSLAAPARLGRRADQPARLALVPREHRRRPLPDRRHLVADRDRRDHDHAAARPDDDQAGLGDGARSPGSRRRSSTRRATRSTEGGGILVLTRPWPAMARTLYKEPERFVETYWDRYGQDTYLVGDAARRDEDGYFWIVGRIDDVINVSGHRLSTMEVESALVSHAKVAEAAVIGVPDEDTGQAIFAFVTLEGDAEPDDELEAELREHVAEKIGKLARPKRIAFADDLPKTRSGKIMRRLLRDIAAGEELGDVTTLRDPERHGRAQGPGRRGAGARGLAPPGGAASAVCACEALRPRHRCFPARPRCRFPRSRRRTRSGSAGRSESSSAASSSPGSCPGGSHGTASPRSQAGGRPRGQRFAIRRPIAAK